MAAKIGSSAADGVSSAKIGGGARKVPSDRQTVHMVNPKTNEIEAVSRQNANDLSTHLGWKWATQDGAPPRARETIRLPDGTVVEGAHETDEDGNDGTEEVGPGTKTEDERREQPVEKTAEDKALEEVIQLRAELTNIGVEVDARWGKKTLLNKLEEAKESK